MTLFSPDTGLILGHMVDRQLLYSEMRCSGAEATTDGWYTSVGTGSAETLPDDPEICGAAPHQLPRVGAIGQPEAVPLVIGILYNGIIHPEQAGEYNYDRRRGHYVEIYVPDREQKHVISTAIGRYKQELVDTVPIQPARRRTGSAGWG